MSTEYSNKTILWQLFVLQVHNRSEYLYHLVSSLRSARDIERTLLIFSHDVYSSELNSIVASIDFCPVSQMISLIIVLFVCYFFRCSIVSQKLLHLC